MKYKCGCEWNVPTSWEFCPIHGERSTSISSSDEDVRVVGRRLLEFKPGFLPSGCKGDGFEKGDDKQPFFSEAYLYNLLGKEEARTLLALMRPIWRLAGIPGREQP